MEQIIKIALAIIFALAAFSKLSGRSKDGFKESGYGERFMYAIGFAEGLFAVGLFSRYHVWAVIGMLGIILAAIVTLVRQRARPARYGIAVLSLALLTALMISMLR